MWTQLSMSKNLLLCFEHFEDLLYDEPIVALSKRVPIRNLFWLLFLKYYPPRHPEVEQ